MCSPILCKNVHRNRIDQYCAYNTQTLAILVHRHTQYWYTDTRNIGTQTHTIDTQTRAILVHRHTQCWSNTLTKYIDKCCAQYRSNSLTYFVRVCLCVPVCLCVSLRMFVCVRRTKTFLKPSGYRTRQP